MVFTLFYQYVMWCWLLFMTFLRNIIYCYSNQRSWTFHLYQNLKAKLCRWSPHRTRTVSSILASEFVSHWRGGPIARDSGRSSDRSPPPDRHTGQWRGRRCRRRRTRCCSRSSHNLYGIRKKSFLESPIIFIRYSCCCWEATVLVVNVFRQM